MLSVHQHRIRNFDWSSFPRFADGLLQQQTSSQYLPFPCSYFIQFCEYFQYFSLNLQANDVTEERIIIEMDGDLHFPGVEAFRQSISRAMESAKGPETVLVVDVKQVKEIDYTALKVRICII